jgi:hypothetical protein
MYMTDERRPPWIELQITIPSGSTLRINEDYGETCYVSGCRTTMLSQPYLCERRRVARRVVMRPQRQSKQ